MAPERWQRIEELFRATLEREGSQRAAFLDEACAADPSLRGEVESLIASHEQMGGFLDQPVLAEAPELPTGDQTQSMVGRRIGSHKVTREIGHGGMGAVYLAIRADDEYRKQVAIKLVKRGMDTEAILRRFRNERQILADLDHPNIAKLLDGGTTDDGLSYFIMDHVEGLPIDVYCDSHKLPTVERLKLFRTVCSAVQYAHQHDVVHRDIKPSNIFVTADGVPKLLDFGIAKLLHPDPSSQTKETTSALRPMTPDYASPEQVRGGTITPSSDVYSLGVLLYELLTGHHPYRIKNLTPQEIERTICEEEPERPSAAVHRIEEVPGTDGETPATITPESVSASRDGQLEKLRRHLAGDIDNIVLMALRKEPERRYSSVEQFSEDIRRHLEGLPVIARKDALWYRSAKFIRRNKAAVLSNALALALLVVIGLNLLPRYNQAIDRGIQSLAVLPLENLSQDPEQEYFADGMTDQLITELSKVEALRVISRNSVMQYKRARKKLAEIGRELNVDVVVEGTVLRAGNRVRITAQLIQANTESHLWANSYEGDLTDVLTLQSGVAQAIAGAIRINLTPQDKARLANTRPVNPEAQEAYLRGRYFHSTGTAENNRRAVEYFTRAIALDPSYAPAYAWLADTYRALGANGFDPPWQLFQKAKAAAMKAIEIDPTLPMAHAALGAVEMHYGWNWSNVEKALRRAIELNAHDARAYEAYANYLARMGRFDEALREVTRAQLLDPMSISARVNSGMILLYTRRYDQGVEELRRAVEMGPNSRAAHFYLGQALVAKGLYEEAIAEFQKALTLAGDPRRSGSAWLGYAYALSGKTAEATRILEDLKALSTRTYVSAYNVARIYVGLGDDEQALDWLERAYEERSWEMINLKVGPPFIGLHTNPRFQDLLRRMGFPP